MPKNNMSSVIEVEPLLRQIGTSQTSGDVECIDQKVGSLELLETRGGSETCLETLEIRTKNADCEVVQLTGPAPITSTSTSSVVPDMTASRKYGRRAI